MLFRNEFEPRLRHHCAKLSQILRAGTGVCTGGQNLILRAVVDEVSFLVGQHSLDLPPQRVQMAHPIEQVTLDVIVTGFGARGHTNPEVAVPPDEALCPLRSYRQVCLVKVHKDCLLVVKLVTETHPSLFMLVLCLRKCHKLPQFEDTTVGVGHWRSEVALLKWALLSVQGEHSFHIR